MNLTGNCRKSNVGSFEPKFDWECTILSSFFLSSSFDFGRRKSNLNFFLWGGKCAFLIIWGFFGRIISKFPTCGGRKPSYTQLATLPRPLPDRPSVLLCLCCGVMSYTLFKLATKFATVHQVCHGTSCISPVPRVFLSSKCNGVFFEITSHLTKKWSLPDYLLMIVRFCINCCRVASAANSFLKFDLSCWIFFLQYFSLFSRVAAAENRLFQFCIVVAAASR